MNWKDETIEKLRRYPLMFHSAAAIPKELARLEEEARSLNAVTPGGGGSRKVRAQENRLLDNLTKRQELEQQLDRVRSWVEATGDAIALLEPQEQKILRLLYMEGADATAVSRELGVERSSLYRLRDMALRKLTLAMYGGMES